MEKQLSFCRNCGHPFSGNESFCSFCGTPVSTTPAGFEATHSIGGPSSGSAPVREAGGTLQPSGMEPFINADHANPQMLLNTYQSMDRMPPAKKKRRWLWFLPAGIAVLLIAVFISYRFFASPKVIPHDINEIKGCPEFYDVAFGMSVNEASALIEVEHRAYQGMDNRTEGLESEDGIIYLKEGAAWKLYGIPVEDVICGYDVLDMDSVYFFFSKEKTSVPRLAALFREIYGEPDTSSEEYCGWKGKWTQIEIMNHTDPDTHEKQVTVSYTITPNSQFLKLSFDGPDNDPCGFLDNNYAFDKLPEYFVEGLTVDKDYSVETVEPGVEGYESFDKYTLYPRFDYLGIEAGKTAITFDMGENADAIEIVSYLFLLNEEDVCERMTDIKERLEEIYGECTSCDYTSLLLSSEPGQDHYETSFSDMLIMFRKGQQGMYHITFDSEDEKSPSLLLTIDPRRTYYQGSVSY